MEIWQAIVLGLVQGLTEFLPVSSSGHVAFFQGVFGLSGDGSIFYTLILHLGTLVAVCVVFWRDVLNLFKKPFHTLGYLVIASIPAVITGMLAKILDLDAYLLGNYMWIVLAVFFLTTATLLFVTEVIAKRRENQLPLCFKTVLPMGIAQAIAILPGISRSGSTICAGTLAGCKRDEVAKFSFLMSIPVILGGFLVELVWKLAKGELQTEFASGGSTYGWCIAIGFIISALAGLFAVKVMLKIISKANYKWFSLYLVLMSITCIILQFTCFKV